MGDGVTDDKDLVVRVSGEQAGGKKGQLVMTDVEFSGERDNTGYSGIGNEEEWAVGYGNKSFSFSTENILNESAADLLLELVENDVQPDEAVVRADGVVEARIGKLDWGSFDWTASDDGDVTISLDGKARDTDLERIN